MNGERAAVQNLIADGKMRTLTFDLKVDRSSWIAVRVLPSAHTNPVFVMVGGKPIRASRRSAEWCLTRSTSAGPRRRADQRRELDAARAAYDHAREVYRQRVVESEGEATGIATEPDLKNGATEPTEGTKKTNFSFPFPSLSPLLRF